MCYILVFLWFIFLSFLLFLLFATSPLRCFLLWIYYRFLLSNFLCLFTLALRHSVFFKFVYICVCFISCFVYYVPSLFVLFCIPVQFFYVNNITSSQSTIFFFFSIPFSISFISLPIWRFNMFPCPFTCLFAVFSLSHHFPWSHFFHLFLCQQFISLHYPILHQHFIFYLIFLCILFQGFNFLSHSLFSFVSTLHYLSLSSLSLTILHFPLLHMFPSPFPTERVCSKTNLHISSPIYLLACLTTCTLIGTPFLVPLPSLTNFIYLFFFFSFFYKRIHCLLIQCLLLPAYTLFTC